MSERGGYQVALLVEIDGAVEEHSLDNLPLNRAEELLRQWYRPAWLRRGTGLLLEPPGRQVMVRWRDVLEMRMQPQREVIT